MKKLKLPKMRVPLFECGDIYFCKTKEEWEKVFQFLNLQSDISPEVVGLATSFKSNAGHRVYLIGVFDQSISTLAHESAHIAFDICHDVGVNVLPENANEIFCYLLTRLVEFGELHIRKPA